ncbi:hypothetical protein TRAPUB_3444, partial [Trametes pubescens]
RDLSKAAMLQEDDDHPNACLVLNGCGEVGHVATGIQVLVSRSRRGFGSELFSKWSLMYRLLLEHPSFYIRKTRSSAQASYREASV